jgi:putative transposase
MREAGLVGVHRRRRARVQPRVPARSATTAPDLVRRNFRASGPDRLWVADITYLPTGAGFLYLASIIDAFSRRVVGWSMAAHLRTELVIAALDAALDARQPGPGLVHHSDRGTQYTSLALGIRLAEAGIAASMGAPGTAYDNALAESFFASLETELIDRSDWVTHDEARLAVFDWIERFYNRTRIHSALGYLSPADFERRYRSETSVA